MKDKQKNWTERIQDWKKSGMSQKEFCKQRNISFSVFHYWRKKIKKTDDQFVEIKVHKTIEYNQPIIIILPNSIQIRMQQILDLTMIGKLVRTLKDLV